MPNRSTLLATTALAGVLLACPALAPAWAQPAYNWTGFYIGAHAGYGWGETDIVCAGCDRTEFISPKPAGALFGFQVGANYQTGMWVWGVESDFSAMLAKDTTQFPSIDTGKDIDRLTSRYDWLGTVRAKGGIATGPALWYATGGLAAASVTHSYVIGLGDIDQQDHSKQQVRFGWTVGGGVEYAFAPNWSIKLEYLHVKLQDSNFLMQVNQFPDTNADLRLRNEFDIVRAGVNFRIPPP